jgi:ABC-type phosphate transport system permease subunit
MAGSRVREDVMDSIAIGISVTCLVHCLALPVLIALLPVWSAWLEVPESFHAWLVAFALPFSLGVLWQSARRQSWFGALWPGIGGLALMAAALAVAHPGMEAVITSLGSLMLAAAHFTNWRRRLQRRNTSAA